jgi:uncharacterized protein (TIGR03663 family)
MSRQPAAVARPVDLSFRAARLARARAWAATWWREAVPFFAIAALGLGMRLLQLDAKPLHHDESEHAWFAWQLVSGHGYSYNPVFHGPVQFYLIALADLLFGAGDYVARIHVALAGTVAVFLPFFLRRQLGRVAALTASVAFCLSPAWLYFSRFAREDILVATVTLGLIVVLLRFFDYPRPWQPIAFLGLLAVSFATKETTYITVFVFGLFLAGALVLQGIHALRGGRSVLDGRLLRGATSLGFAPWAWGASTFLVVYTLLFSTFLTNPGGLREGLWGSIDYWLNQQDVNRGGQPWFYYLMLIPAYEWPIVLLGVAGIVVALRRRSITHLFLVWTFVVTLTIFSWASERMPWLVLHSLLPLVLLAGIGAQTLWEARRRTMAKAAFVVVALAALGSLYHSVGLSYFRSADARELYVQVQTSDDVPGVRDRIMRLEGAYAAQHGGQRFVPVVDSWGGTGWPWSWYLRDVPSGYYDMSRPESVQLGPLVLVSEPSHEAMKPRLDGYVGEEFRLRVWWVPVWRAAGVGDWLRWAVKRTAWGPTPTATMNEWLYLKPELARLEPEGR